MTTRDLLARTGTHWALHTSRSQVLSAVAAGSNVVGAWLAEEPHCADGRIPSPSEGSLPPPRGSIIGA
ncbi:hypothetical protein AB0I10_23090 [Streptomyces sp. NPDC050636]|uniref:hypothetical protein n=1 Tax=Streptomyces sp. NPDC050636 TaxID=3154510 RepID=UPI003436372B